ncbi:MAG: hypothetical protein HGA38_05505 [Candidatus Moranbacteria bacterium]|nr:hypothetical protein [Candidatus Moranbacteria bacterium]
MEHAGEGRVEIQEIGEIVGRAVEREIRNPQLPEEALRSLLERSKDRVAGFPITDMKYHSELVDQATRTLKERWSKYGSTEVRMRQELERRGISPIAILPLKAWEKLYRAAGLYEMNISGGGMVNVDLKGLQSIAEKRKSLIENVIFSLCMCVVAACAVWAGWLFWSSVLVPKTPVFIAWMACGFFGLIGGILSFMAMFVIMVSFHSEELRVSPLIEWAVTRRLCKSLSWRGMLEYLMPDRRSESAGTPVTVVLPKITNDSVHDILVRAKGLPLRTIADPEMFGFEEDVESLLRGKQKQMREERREESRRLWAEMLRDPIVAWYDHGVVAVIVQWGDSPFEKRVVEQVACEHDLL